MPHRSSSPIAWRPNTSFPLRAYASLAASSAEKDRSQSRAIEQNGLLRQPFGPGICAGLQRDWRISTAAAPGSARYSFSAAWVVSVARAPAADLEFARGCDHRRSIRRVVVSSTACSGSPGPLPETACGTARAGTDRASDCDPRCRNRWSRSRPHRPADVETPPLQVSPMLSRPQLAASTSNSSCAYVKRPVPSDPPVP